MAPPNSRVFTFPSPKRRKPNPPTSISSGTPTCSPPSSPIPSIPSFPQGLVPLSESLSLTSNHVSRLHSALVALSHREIAKNAYARRSKPHLDAAEDCPICLDALRAPGSCLTRCGHMFHVACIHQYLEAGGNDCPLCKRDIASKAELSLVMSGIPSGTGVEGGCAPEGMLDNEGNLVDSTLHAGGIGGVVRTVRNMMDRGGEVMGKLDRVEDEISRVRSEWNQEVDEARNRLREIGKEKGQLEKERNDVRHARADLDMQKSELAEKWDEVHKGEMEVISLKRELEKGKRTLEEERMTVVEEKLTTKRMRVRLERLYDERSASGVRIGGKERELRTQIDKLKKEIDKLKKEIEVNSKGSSAISMVFGDRLQKPSEINRPSAPRRSTGGVALGGFGQRRNKVQRPGRGIGDRRK